eukprot:10686299-Lingulodinium_polyedra.AAC.1
MAPEGVRATPAIAAACSAWAAPWATKAASNAGSVDRLLTVSPGELENANAGATACGAWVSEEEDNTKD